MLKTTHLLLGLALALTAGSMLSPTPVVAQELRVPRSWQEFRGFTKAQPGIAVGFPGSSAAAASAVAVGESEPNNVAGQAQRVSLGDRVTGAINPAGDVDFFVFAATAQTMLDLDVDARSTGSSLDSTLELLGPDGTTRLAFNDDAEGLDSRIRFAIPADGDYYAVLRAFGGSGGTTHTYALALSAIEPGPGDPPAVVSSVFQFPWDVAADESGDLFVSDLITEQIVRLTSNGGAEIVASVPRPLAMAFDGFGNLLVLSSGTMVVQLSPGGAPMELIEGLVGAREVAVAPDGDIWVGERTTLLQFDPFGAPKGRFPLTGVRMISDIAFSPAGELYFSDGFTRVHRLVGQDAQVFIQGAGWNEGLAFDESGNLYVAKPNHGVALYGPDGSSLEYSFAVVELEIPIRLAFGRDPDGSTNSRLYATHISTQNGQLDTGSLIELNASGIVARGRQVGARLLTIAQDSLSRGLMGAEYREQLTVTDALVSPVWSHISGQMPAGLGLTAGGVVSGIPEASGLYEFRVRAQAGNRFGEQDYVIEVDEPVLVRDHVADALLGGSAITAAEERYLDLIGNGNGRFDVGDFRAFLMGEGPQAISRERLLELIIDLSPPDNHPRP